MRGGGNLAEALRYFSKYGVWMPFRVFSVHVHMDCMCTLMMYTADVITFGGISPS